jgi:hypothetical protein
MVVKVETAILGDTMLALFDFRIVELFNTATLQAHEMVVVAPFIELKYGATTFKVVPLE